MLTYQSVLDEKKEIKFCDWRNVGDQRGDMSFVAHFNRKGARLITIATSNEE